MEKIVFDDSLMVGVDLIDEQHKELINRINNFLAKVEVSDLKSFSSELEQIFDFMADYASYHFSDEEKLMESHSCPILEFQKVQHQFFIMEANKLKFDLKTKGLTQELLTKSQKLLVDWIKSHISQMDKKIKDCVHKESR